MWSSTSDQNDQDNGKPLPPAPKKRPKQRHLNSDGTYSGYSGTEEGLATIENKRILLARNQGPSLHNRNKAKR